MGNDATDTGEGEAAQFASWRSFWNFQHEVGHDWRYVRSPQSQRFLAAVAIGCRSRVTEIAIGRKFYRAQVAHHDEPIPDVDDTVPGAALPARMRPLRDRATEGRVNPKGIPCLYVASDKHTAMAESRPWIGSLVSVAVFRTIRPLRVVDCTQGAGRNPFYMDDEPSPAKRAEAVWVHIARAFREPVTRNDDVADYAATQAIAEIFRREGFDGLAYRSAFGTDRFNIALFDLNAAELVMCTLHEIRDVELKHQEVANPYYVRDTGDGSTALVQNVVCAAPDPSRPLS
jgi:hypothetical protein